MPSLTSNPALVPKDPNENCGKAVVFLFIRFKTKLVVEMLRICSVYCLYNGKNRSIVLVIEWEKAVKIGQSVGKMHILTNF